MKLSEQRGNMLHGVLLIALFSCAAFYISEFPVMKHLSFSPLIIGIVLGMLYANSLRNRYVGSRNSVLLEKNIAVGYYPLWIPTYVSGCRGGRTSGHIDRRDHRNDYDSIRRTAREVVEDGSGHRSVDFDRKRNLRGGSDSRS